MKIRPYQSIDFVRIIEIYNLSKLDELAHEPLQFELIPLERDEERLVDFHASTIYVFDDPYVVGFGGYRNQHLSWLFVHPDYRGKKIGKRILQHCLSRLCGEITLNVVKSNRVAQQLYLNLGFVFSHELIGEYQGEFVDVSQYVYRK